MHNDWCIHSMNFRAVSDWGTHVCIADFLSRFAQTGRPGGPINARRDGRVSAFLGEDPRTSTTIIISLPTTLRSQSRRLHQVWLFFFTSPRPKKQLRGGEELLYHSIYRSASLWFWRLRDGERACSSCHQQSVVNRSTFSSSLKDCLLLMSKNVKHAFVTPLCYLAGGLCLHLHFVGFLVASVVPSKVHLLNRYYVFLIPLKVIHGA